MCAGFTLSTELAAKANESKAKRTFEEMVPEEYRKYTKVFSEVESQRLPEHQPWDHTIDLKEGAPETLKSNVYPIPINEQEALNQFLDENLAKGNIAANGQGGVRRILHCPPPREDSPPKIAAHEAVGPCGAETPCQAKDSHESNGLSWDMFNCH